jgi:hypothetical protein
MAKGALHWPQPAARNGVVRHQDQASATLAGGDVEQPSYPAHGGVAGSVPTSRSRSHDHGHWTWITPTMTFHGVPARRSLRVGGTTTRGRRPGLDQRSAVRSTARRIPPRQDTDRPAGSGKLPDPATDQSSSIVH